MEIHMEIWVQNCQIQLKTIVVLNWKTLTGKCLNTNLGNIQLTDSLVVVLANNFQIGN